MTQIQRAPDAGEVLQHANEPPKRSLDTVLRGIAAVAGKVAERVVEGDQEATRVVSGLYSYLRRCDPRTLGKLVQAYEQQPGDFVAAVLHLVELRIPLGTPGHWALVPFFNSRAERWDLTPMVMVGGVRYLASLHGYRDLSVQLVREGEEFEEVYGLEPSVRYVPMRPQDQNARVVAALVTFSHRGERGCFVIDGSKLERVERFAKRRGGDAWRDWRPEMLRKTALHAWYRTLPSKSEREAGVLASIERSEAGERALPPEIIEAVEAAELDGLHVDAAPPETEEEATDEP